MFFKGNLTQVSSKSYAKLKHTIKFNNLINTISKVSTDKYVEKGKINFLQSLTYPNNFQNILNARKNSQNQEQNQHDPPSHYKQENDRNKQPPSQKEIQKLIFCPQILKNHLISLIVKQLSFWCQKDDQTTIQHLTKTFYTVRSFINLTLKLDPSLSTINEALFAYDYKIDIINKIMENEFKLIDLLQEELSQSLAKNQPQKAVLIVMSQMVVLTKILQIVPHIKAFNWQKFWMVIKSWEERVDYFRQSFHFGVSNSSFKKAEPYLVMISKNATDLSLKSPKIKNYIELLIDELLQLKSFSCQIQKGKRGYKDDFKNLQKNYDEKIGNFFSSYRKELDDFHQRKVLQFQLDQNLKKLSPPQEKTEYIQTVIEKDEICKLEVDYRYVEYGLTLYFSSQYMKQQKVDMLNDIKEYIYNQYVVYEDQEEVRKEQRKQMKQSGKETLLFVNPNLSKQPLVAYDYSQYLSANLVYTWLIYRVEETEDPVNQ